MDSNSGEKWTGKTCGPLWSRLLGWALYFRRLLQNNWQLLTRNNIFPRMRCEILVLVGNSVFFWWMTMVLAALCQGAVTWLAAAMPVKGTAWSHNFDTAKQSFLQFNHLITYGMSKQNWTQRDVQFIPLYVCWRRFRCLEHCWRRSLLHCTCMSSATRE